MKKNILQQKGFSLIEVIIVLFVVAIGLLGLLTLITSNLNAQHFNKQNIIAYQLAQEGVELIRAVRDDNWKNGQVWNTNLDEGDYYMDYLDTIPIVTNDGAKPLYLNNNNFYVHDSVGTELTAFKRLITIENINEHEIRVSVKIYWSKADNTYSYILEALLYDWK